MRPRGALAGAAALLAVVAGQAVADEGAWWAVPGPAPGPAAAVGGTGAGCLAGGVALPLSGAGYEVMRPSRRRYFAHPRLIRFVEELAAAAQASGLPPVLIGDLAQPRGGPMRGGHASHQTGLDVDVWFRPARSLATAHSLDAEERESLSALSMVAPGGSSVDRDAWGPDQATLLHITAGIPEVDRIFVHAAIKAELCAATVPGDRDWLHKIRPWWGHDDHFHVRLRCPDGEGACENQAPLPAGDGCDETLQWWFSADAAAELAKRAKTPTRRPSLADLPDACRAILDAPPPQ